MIRLFVLRESVLRVCLTTYFVAAPPLLRKLFGVSHEETMVQLAIFR